MNHIYRLVWNRVSNAWVAVAESACGRGKGSSCKLVAAALSLTASFAQAAPAGGQVTSGAGSVAQSGNTTTITQSSENLSLKWQGFNIAKQETVNFVQPSASAIAVNRILDTNGSQILGQLNANGQVYLINPNGILFGQGAQVNVGSLVASTLDLNDASLNSAMRSFSGTGAGSIVNQGTINAARGGYVALLGNTVSNQGTITAPQGTVALGAGNAVTLNFNGNSLVKMQIDQSVLNSLAESGGLIQADGGLVVMKAGAKDALLASVVNNTGVIEARTVENHEGTIVLLGGMAAGTVNVGGTLDASAPNGGNGGFIETSAAQVKIANDAQMTTAAPAGKTGTWLIDPVDFTIATAGGDITGAALGNLLATNSVTIQTATSPTKTATNLTGAIGNNGDIHVNDAASWSANNTLTLDAYRNININQSITATGTSGKLALKYGQGATDGVIGGVAADINVKASVNLKAGNNFSTQMGSTGSVKNFTVITSLGAQGSTTAIDLQGISGNLGGNYVLGSNIDAGTTSGWSAGAGFAPIGTFIGTFDGLGHTISNLTQNNALNASGLFSQIGAAGTVKNLGLTDVSISKLGNGNNIYLIPFGALTGTNAGSVSNVYSTGTINNSGPDYNAFGGLAGVNTGSISNAYSSATLLSGVWGTSVGGLVGINSGTISSSYAAGAVTGSGRYVNVGGLVGKNTTGSVTSSYAIGAVSSGGTPSSNAIGGLVGLMSGGGIGNVYAAGLIDATKSNVIYGSGLIGRKTGGSISNSLWDTTTSNRATGIGNPWDSQSGVTGLTSSQMMQMASFSSWNTATPNSIAKTGGSGAVWRIYEGHTAPLLTSFMTGLTLSDASVTYNGTEKTGTTTGRSGVSGIAAKGTNAGTYLNSYYSSQQGYDISGGNLTINAAALGAISLSGTRAYDGTVDVAASIFTLSGLVNGEDLTLTGSGTVADKNVGSNKTVTLGSLTLGNGNGGLASNYTFTGGTQTASITKADLAVSGLSATNKVYDTTRVATLGGTAAVAALGSDVVTLGGTASGVFADKNVATAKSVSVTGNTLGGADAGNYNLLQQTGLTADISKASLAVTGLTTGNKVYDANTTATLGGTAAVTALGSDVVTLGGTASGSFANKNVGNAKDVSVSGNTITGTDAGNYNLQQQTGLSADISKASLAVTGLTAGNKVYDANTTATLGGTAAVAALRGDAVNVSGSGSGTFSNSNVGPGKAVTVSGFSLSGTDAGNYAVMQPTGITADITAPEAVRNVTTQLVSTVLAPTMGVQLGALSLSPSITVVQNSSPVTPSSNSPTVAAGEASPSKADKGPVVNVTMSIGTMGSTLQIISGGVKLPGNRVNVNE